MALHCFVQWKSALLTPLIYVFCIWCLSYSPQWASCAQDMMPECPSSLLRQVRDRWSFLLKVSSRPVAKQMCSTSSRAFPVVDSSLSVSAELTGSCRSPRAKPSQGWMGFVPWPSLSSFTHQARKDGKKEEKESALDSIPTGLQVTNWTNWGRGFVKSAAWLQSENKPCSQMLPTVSCRTTQKGFHQLLGLLPGMGAPTLLSAQSTCFTCILFLHLWAAGLQTAAATYMASGEVLAYLRWSKIQQWWPSRQINIFCIAAEIPFPPILTLNSAFMQLCSNDYRFGKELQSEKEKKSQTKIFPSSWAAGSCSHNYKFLSCENCIYSSQTNPRTPPLPRSLGPGWEHNGPDWFTHLWDASPGSWACCGSLILALQHKLSSKEQAENSAEEALSLLAGGVPWERSQHHPLEAAVADSKTPAFGSDMVCFSQTQPPTGAAMHVIKPVTDF